MNKEELNELIHSGIKGQKWGIRRYQYEDGSLTPEGKERYGYGKGGNNPTNNRNTIKEKKKFDLPHNTSKAALEVKKRKTEFTDDELQQIINRLRLETQLDTYSKQAEESTFKYKFNQIVKKASSSLIDSAVKALTDNLFKMTKEKIENKMKKE